MTESERIRLRILRELENNPGISQRELARRLGISLGKANYCLRALLAKGLVKLDRFRKSPNKRAYLYVLTPAGIEERMRLTREYLRIVAREYELLRKELAQMEARIEQDAFEMKAQKVQGE